MPTRLDDVLDAAGYAKVICVLEPDAAADAFGNTSRALEGRFVVPPRSLAAGLAADDGRGGGIRARSAPNLARVSAVRVFPHLNLAVGFVDRRAVRDLRAEPRVRDIVDAPELSLIRPVASSAAAIRPGPTWGIERLNVPPLWKAGFDGTGVVVGHLDTGADGSHPALAGAIKAFAEFDLAGDPVTDPEVRDSGEHGTHTAGTIAGRPTDRGRFGVAPGCQLASAMVIEGGQVIDRILGGLDWIVAQGARVLSMSLGLRGYTPAFKVVIDALIGANVLPVIAVGNEHAGTSRSPGNYPEVLSVGAFGDDGRVADFSGSQIFARPDDPLVPDLVAPGVGVLSCVPGNAYAEMDGSSMATPHVAGLAALLLQAKPSATTSDLQEALFASCHRPPTMPSERANRGVPDAVAAYRSLVGSAPAGIA